MVLVQKPTSAAAGWLERNTTPAREGGYVLSNPAQAKLELAENWNLTNADRLELVARLPAAERQALLADLPGWQRSQVLGESATDVKALRAHQTGPVYDVDFDDLTRGHSSARAHTMAVLAKRAYEDLGTPGQWITAESVVPAAFRELVRDGWSVLPLGTASSAACSADTGASTQAFLAKKGDKFLFSARGTEPDKLQDLLVDARTCRVPTPHGLSHEGFLEATDQIWPDVLKALEEAGPGARLHITGHSLGAAIATEVAMRVVDQLGDKATIDGVYTFGSPRVYDHDAATAYNRALGDRTYRYCNHRDVVTIIPPSDFGFEHVGRRMYFDNDGSLQPGFSPDQIAKDKFRPIEVLTSTIANAQAGAIWDHGSYVKVSFLTKGDRVDFPKTNLEQLKAAIRPATIFEEHLSPHSVLTCLTSDERSRLLFDLPKGLATSVVDALQADHADDLRAWLAAAPAAVAKHASFKSFLAA